jgi:hypothetical protein
MFSVSSLGLVEAQPQQIELRVPVSAYPKKVA